MKDIKSAVEIEFLPIPEAIGLANSNGFNHGAAGDFGRHPTIESSQAVTAKIFLQPQGHQPNLPGDLDQGFIHVGEGKSI